MVGSITRTARFFPEPDDLDEIRSEYADENVKVNEYLYRRVDIEDAVAVHLLALAKAPSHLRESSPDGLNGTPHPER